MTKTKVIIMGAAGRDFHNFNVFFRDNPDYEVVCFTATQIPGIENRTYPKELSGQLYPKGIPIYPENNLQDLIKKNKADQVILAYSDLPHEYVMHRASEVLAAGSDFRLMGPDSTMLKSRKPIISVTAVRTGSGKSQTTRKICLILKKLGKRAVAVRHPMPYGDLKKQACQRFASYKDLETNECTIEEREEYEPLISKGIIVYAGVNYEKILRSAESEADIIVWDGGNNDFSFFRPDLSIVVVDPHRAGHELSYHPGETNLRMADVVVINKENTAKPGDIKTVETNTRKANSRAKIIHADSVINIETQIPIKGKTVLVIEDGPTLTHGSMPYGAGTVAAKMNSCVIIDPKPYAYGSIKEVYKNYSHLDKILPAMGYSKAQVKELESVINRTQCDLVIDGSPVNLSKLIKVNKPLVNVGYELVEKGKPGLENIIKEFLKKYKI